MLKKKALHDRNESVLNKLESLFETPSFFDSSQQESANTRKDSDDNIEKSQSNHQLKNLRVNLKPIDSTNYIRSTSQTTINNASQQQSSSQLTRINACQQLSTSQTTKNNNNTFQQDKVNINII